MNIQKGRTATLACAVSGSLLVHMPDTQELEEGEAAGDGDFQRGEEEGEAVR